MNKGKMMPADLSRLFRETLNEVAELRLQADGLACYNEAYRYGLGEKQRHLTTLLFVNSAVESLGYRAKILEIGCGDGLMPLMFKKIDLEVSAVDVTDPPQLGNYGIMLKKIFNDSNIVFTKCNLVSDSIPFPDATFDFVHMGAVFEHLPSAHKKIIKEIKRVLKNNGFLIMDTPNIANFANRVAFLFGKSVFGPVEQFCDTDSYRGHFREFTLGEMESILNSSGLKIVWTKMLNLSLLPVLKYEKLTMGNRLKYVMVFSLATVVSTFLPRLRHCIWIAAEKVA